jgi:hypothetical protein
MTLEQIAAVSGVKSLTLTARIAAFQSLLVLVIMTEHWSRVIRHWNLPGFFLVGSAVAVTALGGLVLLGRSRRIAFVGMALVVVSYLTIVFPGGGNHEYLELLLCLLCAALDSGDDKERLLMIDAVRWMTCVILFWSGVQKMVHGFYFEGEYLAYSVSRDTYASVFSWLLPADELARLAAYDGSAGTGPYVTQSRPFLLVSNLTCVLEITLAPLFLLRVTPRSCARCGSLLAVIESAARELFFFFVLLNMLLLFVESDLNRRLIGPIAVILGCMLLVRMGAAGGDVQLTFALKKALVYTALVGLTLWPAVHIWLVKSYGVSAWKLGGWGMYATPRPKFLGMEVFYRERGVSEYQRLRKPPGPVEAVAKNFIERYRWLGHLAFPQDFARALLAMNPGWEQCRSSCTTRLWIETA